MPRFALHILALIIVTLMLGCRADDTIKQGADGEFCNDSDLDCRPGHICDRSFCRAQAIDGTNCESMCQRIAFCEADEPDCLQTCLATIAGGCSAENPCPWSDEAVDTFGSCIINDLSCAELQSGDAPQICYEQIPLNEERRAICDGLIEAGTSCEPGADTVRLRSACYRLARTTTDEGFARVDECTDRVEDGFCSEIED